MTKRNLRFFDLAKKEAAASGFRQKVGCVLVCGNRVLAKAHNSEKTHTEQMIFNSFREFNQEKETVVHKVHAEVAALAKARYADVDWSKAEIYIWREMRNGQGHGMASPCPACREAIRRRGLRHLYYTGNDSLVYEYCYKE